MLKSGKSAQEAFRANSRLKHEAAALAVSLRTEHEKSVAANSQLYQLANHDSLTGLFNRAAFSEALDGLLDVARATPDASVTLFLIDMDHFKSINDTLGHKAGDDVLKEVATRLRAASAAHDVVARLGGDEFAILRPTTNGRLDDAAEALIAATNGAFLVGGRPITIGISVGIATFPDDCVSSVELFTRADLALYAAKHAGRRRAQHFEKGMLTATELLWDIEHDLQQALDDGALEVWYQPQVALVDGKLVGLEALIRWNHPRHGWISPPQIVAAAQRTNSSHLLTGYVLKNAGTQLSQLTDMGRNDVRVSVNISPNELDQYDLPELLRGLIERQRLDPRRLELEITEEAFVSSETAIATLKTLSAMNFRLAIDDFGTGCSSISYFRSLHVDRIKIDRSFVTGFCEREGDRTLVQTMLGIGCSLGIEVIAEGIETAEEAELLLSLGCQIAQGYFFARALAPQALEAWMLRQLLPRGQDAGSLEIDGVMAIADTA